MSKGIVSLQMLLLLLGFSAACDYKIEFPGDYELAKIYSNCYIIYDAKSSDILIDQAYIEYRVLGAYVLGFASESSCPRSEFEPPAKEDYYFIINTATRDMVEYPDHDQWLSAARTQGITETEPLLEKPTRFHSFRSYRSSS